MEKKEHLIVTGQMCPVHGYLAGPQGLPAQKCVQCWRVFYTFILSGYPLNEQLSVANELYKTLKYFAEHPEKVDYKIFQRPVIESIEKN